MFRFSCAIHVIKNWWKSKYCNICSRIRNNNKTLESKTKYSHRLTWTTSIWKTTMCEIRQWHYFWRYFRNLGLSKAPVRFMYDIFNINRFKKKIEKKLKIWRLIKQDIFKVKHVRHSFQYSVPFYQILLLSRLIHLTVMMSGCMMQFI